jgi:protein required for attachment to host cells
MTMKTPQTLYLLASDHSFRLVHTHGTGVAALGEKSAEDFPDVDFRFPREQLERSVAVHTEANARSEAVQSQRNRLARHAIAALEAQWARGGFDRIVLVAGPKMLGDLRHYQPKSLAGHVTAELHKDLMKIPLHELPAHLAEVPGV